MAESAPEDIRAQIEWPLEHPVWDQPRPANQVAFQINPGPDGVTPDTVVVSFGYVTTPTIAGNPDQQLEYLRGLRAPGNGPVHLPIKPQARIILSMAQARRMSEALDEMFKAFDGQTGEAS